MRDFCIALALGLAGPSISCREWSDRGGARNFEYRHISNDPSLQSRCCAYMHWCVCACLARAGVDEIALFLIGPGEAESAKIIGPCLRHTEPLDTLGYRRARIGHLVSSTLVAVFILIRSFLHAGAPPAW